MSNREFTATRTMLANAFATAGAELLDYMGTAAALAAIPNTDPPRYVVAGTLAMIAKVLPSADAPAAATVLTDEVRAAMKRAYSLGQTYWQQADSEYTSQHKKADVTAGRFIELTDEICSKVAVLAKEAAIEAPNDPKQLAKWWSLRGSVITAAINQEPARFPVEDLSELLNVFDAALPDESNGSSDLAHAGVTAEPAAPIDIAALVNRFLAWPLPASLTGSMHMNIERPIGTHLMNAGEAKAMFEHCLNGAVRPTDDDLWDQTLRDRETYREWADKLSEAIAKHFDAYIGEHSNMNCPWAEALEVIEGAQVPAAEVRAQALEEAARICDRQALEPECPERAAYCAAAIRALASKEAAAEAPSQRDAAPQGWKLVPVEPTWTMCVAGRMEANRHHFGDEQMAAVYKHMLAAAPAEALNQGDEHA